MRGDKKSRRERYKVRDDVERVMGIEPTRPAWKAGILAIELHPHLLRFNILSKKYALVKKKCVGKSINNANTNHGQNKVLPVIILTSYTIGLTVNLNLISSSNTNLYLGSVSGPQLFEPAPLWKPSTERNTVFWSFKSSLCCAFISAVCV